MSSLDKEQIAVLLVDDDEDDYLIIKHVFSQIPDSPFILAWCSSFENAKQLITDHVYDMYLVDYRLGERTGLELLEFAQPHTRIEPFILLTGAGDKETERQSIELAAADYLVKGTFTAELLSRTLLYALGRKQIEAQRVEHLIELNKTKDEFISLASHQLRTPATGVKQYIGMILEGFAGEVSQGQRTLLKKAYESNERQLSIVSNLLNVAQVDAGKVKLRKEPIELVELVADVIKEQRATLAARHQKVEYIHAMPRLELVMDTARMRMVFENFLDNASKYSDAGKTIWVEITQNDRMAFVRITDQGVGIDLSDQSKLFVKFSRIYNPLSTHVDGTGLGLYWAKQIVDLHGGTIAIDSAIGEGTTFSINLPKHP
ncbi:MAG: ATP-binding protein [Candidatus Saccharimonadales bacterium]